MKNVSSKTAGKVGNKDLREALEWFRTKGYLVRNEQGGQSGLGDYRVAEDF